MDTIAHEVPDDRNEDFGPEVEERAKHIWTNLIEDGQRLALVTKKPDTKKSATRSGTASGRT